MSQTISKNITPHAVAANPTAPLFGIYLPATWYCDDIHTGANKDMALAIPPLVAGFSFYGQAGVSDHQGFDGYSQLVIAPNPGGTWTQSKPPLVAPDVVIRRWEKTGYGGMCVVTFGSSDPDYVSLGDFYIRDYAENVKPNQFPGLVCVHHSLVTIGQYKSADLWDDVGSGAQDDVSLWAVDDQTVRTPSGQSPSSIFRSVQGYPENGVAAARLNSPVHLDPTQVLFIG